MSASFHIVGCVIAAKPEQELIGQLLGRARRQGADVLAQNDREAVFVKFDAADAQLIVLGCRAVISMQPSPLRLGFASGVKEVGAGGTPRVGERGILQAADLAGAAADGQVLVSSQLGSLIQIAQAEFASQMHSVRVKLLDGRMASAYAIDWRARPKLPDSSSA